MEQWNVGTKLGALHAGQPCHQQSEWNFREKEGTENVFHTCFFLHHHNFVLNLPPEWKELEIECRLCFSSLSPRESRSLVSDSLRLEIECRLCFSSLSPRESRSLVSDSLRPHGVYSPWNSPGQNAGVGSLSLSRGSSRPKNWTGVSCIAGRFFTNWVGGKPLLSLWSYISECFTHVLCCKNYHETWGVWFKYKYEFIYGRITNNTR